MLSPGAGYRPDIDGLRGIAVVAVVIFHAFPQCLPGGFVGVDVFFVISGFLITSILHTDLQRGRFSYRDFYARRVRRLIPALLLVLLSTCLLGWWVLFPEEFEALCGQVLAGLFFVSNIYQWSDSGYFDAPAQNNPLLHLWSLGVEEQFYLIWPPILYALYRAGARPLLWVSTLSFASFLYGLRLQESDPSGAFYLPHSRFWQIGAGACLALLPAAARVKAPAFALLGAIVVLASFALIPEGYRYPGLYALAPTLGAALLIWQAPHSRVLHVVLCARPVVATGLISYPLYLWHWPGLVLLSLAYGGSPHWAARLLILVLSVVLAWLTWRFVEIPIRSSRSALVQTRLAVAALLLCAPLLWVYFDARENTPAAIADDRSVELAASEPGCLAYVGDLRSPYCRLHDPQRAPRIALLGDSHADHLYVGLAAALGERGENLLQLGDNGCPPLDGILRPDLGYARCLPMQKALDFALADANIEIIILAARWPMFVAGNAQAPIPNLQVALLDSRHPGETDGASMLSAALERTLGAAQSAGKEVWFVHAVPELNFEPGDCSRQRPITRWLGLTRSCLLGPAALHARLAVYRPLLDRILAQHPTVQSFDPQALLCTSDGCRGRLHGAWLYRDNNHLSAAGSALVGSALADKIVTDLPPNRLSR